MGDGKVVNIVQVQGSVYEGLKCCFKYSSCETQIYTRKRGDLAKGKRERKKEVTQINCSQRSSVKSECSVPYLCSFWILQKMARSRMDVCLRSSQGETDPGRIVRDPESILVFGAEYREILLRQCQQE